MTYCKKHIPLTLAILGAFWFAVCYFWGFVIPVDIRPLHTELLRMSVLGWSGMNFMSLLLGAVEWFVWGYLIGASCVFVGNWCEKKCSHEKK